MKLLIPPRFWGLFLCLPPLLISSITEYYTLAVFWVGLLVIGIPHGAIDHHLHLKSEAHNFRKLLPFILKYVTWMLLFLLFWVISSDLALIFFVILSAWHFGMVDFGHPKQFLKRIMAVIYGFSLLGFLLLSHKSEVLPILEQLRVSDTYLQVFSGIGNSVMLFLLIVLGLLITIWSKHALWSTFLLFLAGIYLPLLLVFGIYFSFQHALESTLAMKKFLKVDVKSLIRFALPFSLGAYLVGTFVFLGLRLTNIQLEYSIPYAFLFLGMITLPHVIYYRFDSHK